MLPYIIVYLVLLSLYNQPMKSMLLSHTTDEEVLEKTLESPSDSKEIKPVYPKGNQSWIFTGRTDTEAEAPIPWTPDMKSQLTGKDPDAGKDWRQEKGVAEDEMVGWHHWLNGHEFEQTLGEKWWTGKLGMLQSMRSQRVRDYLATEQQQDEGSES